MKNLIKSTEIQIPEVEKPQGSVIPPILIQKRQARKPFTLVKNPAGGETYQIFDLDELDLQQSDVVLSQKVGATGAGMPLTPFNAS